MGLTVIFFSTGKLKKSFAAARVVSMTLSGIP
jgi:hypothetical protein